MLSRNGTESCILGTRSHFRVSWRRSPFLCNYTFATLAHPEQLLVTKDERFKYFILLKSLHQPCHQGTACLPIYFKGTGLKLFAHFFLWPLQVIILLLLKFFFSFFAEAGRGCHAYSSVPFTDSGTDQQSFTAKSQQLTGLPDCVDRRSCGS